MQRQLAKILLQRDLTRLCDWLEAGRAVAPDEALAIAAALREGSMRRKRGPKPRRKSNDALWRVLDAYWKERDRGAVVKTAEDLAYPLGDGKVTHADLRKYKLLG